MNAIDTLGLTDHRASLNTFYSIKITGFNQSLIKIRSYAILKAYLENHHIFEN